MSLIAGISNISRCSVHDGPGVRTVVYFKGCGLRCRWCHNPETLSAENDILYAPVKCIRCGRCISVCPEHHRIDGNDMAFLRDGCRKCGKCAESCPTGALSASGRSYTLDEVWREIVKDEHFYRATGGGVTLSGGECLLQPDFAAALMKICREKKIHTAVESALFVPWENIEKVLPFCDLFMADLKIADPEKHRRYTGQDNLLIVDNLKSLVQRAEGKVLVRIPLIPGVNDSDADMEAFAEVLCPVAGRLHGVELLKYNAMAEGKYRLAGMKYEKFGDGPQTDEHTEKLRSILSRLLSGTDIHI